MVKLVEELIGGEAMLPAAIDAGGRLTPLIVPEVAPIAVQFKVVVSPFQTPESEEERVQLGQALSGGGEALQLPSQAIVPELVPPQALGAEVQELP